MKNLNPIKSVPGKIILLLAGLLVTNKVSAQCNVGFTYTVGSGGVVQFQNTTTGTTPNTIYFWNFGDMNNVVDASPIVTHTYSSSGMYPVSLYAGSSDSSCFGNAWDTLNLTGLPCLAPVSFNSSQDSLQPLNWRIYPNYPGNIVSATWSWGDGSSSSGLYPTHTYTAAGTYSICVTVSVSCGGTNTFCVNTSVFRSSQGASVISITVVGSTPTAIRSNVLKSLNASVYPNPVAASAKLSFYSPAAAPYKVSILTIDGRQVTTELVQAAPGENTAELRTENLQSGLYFISLTDGKAQKTIRLVKE